MNILLKSPAIVGLFFILVAICMLVLKIGYLTKNQYGEGSQMIPGENSMENHALRPKARESSGAPDGEGEQMSLVINGKNIENLMFQTPRELAEMLKSMDRNASAALINKCGQIVRTEIESGGDFNKIRDLLNVLPVGFARYLMTSWIIGASSKAGTTHDFIEQQKLIMDSGLDKDSTTYSRFLSVTGGKSANDLVDMRHELQLEVEDVGEILCGSINENGVEATFDAARKLAHYEKSEIEQILDRVIPRMLAEDPEMTSNLIANMEPGVVKNSTIRPLVVWLLKKRETERAFQWSELLEKNEVNNTLRDRVVEARNGLNSTK